MRLSPLLQHGRDLYHRIYDCQTRPVRSLPRQESQSAGGVQATLPAYHPTHLPPTPPNTDSRPRGRPGWRPKLPEAFCSSLALLQPYGLVYRGGCARSG
jgi:hypothetical protein